MAGAVRGLQFRDRRYYARIVVPQPLRAVIGKIELREALGADRREALRKLPVSLAAFAKDIDRARRIAGVGAPISKPLNNAEIARLVYDQALELDDLERNIKLPPDEDGRQFSRFKFNEMMAPEREKVLRRVASGEAEDDEAAAVVGYLIDALKARGATDVRPATPEWRSLSRMLAGITLEAMQRTHERDRGDQSGKPTMPILTAPVETNIAPVSLIGLFEAYGRELARSGRGRGAMQRWRSCFASLKEFIGHDDATRLTKRNVIDWKEALLETLEPSTIRDAHLAGLKVVLGWAVENEALSANVADGVRIRVPKKARSRDRAFSDAEALAILKASSKHMPAVSANPRTREGASLTAAKRWVSWLQAFSGARVAEICQLRGKDFEFDGEIPSMTITPDAGSVKTGEPRSIPLHEQLLERGLQNFVESCGAGPLFYDGSSRRKAEARPANAVAGRLSEWIRDLKIIPAGVQPTHGWRHRFKTIGRDLGADARVVDAIQGHAPRTSGDGYGGVSLAAMKRVMDQLPHYPV